MLKIKWIYRIYRSTVLEDRLGTEGARAVDAEAARQ